MKKILNLIFLSALTLAARAQTATTPTIETYGKVSQADLDLKQCDFEPDANAEVLFDYGVMDGKAGLPMGHHTRIKIFNEFGKGYGNVQLEYYSFQGAIGIYDLKGETINQEDGKVVITTLDKKDVFTVRLDKWRSAIKFAMPNVKPGSIIEFTYRQLIPSVWRFQNYIPVRYSEVEINITGNPNFKSIPYVKQPYVKSKGETTDPYQTRAMANIHSMPNEPFIGSRIGNLQRVEFIGINTLISTWPKIGELLIKANDFGYDLDRNLSGESGILAKAKTLKSDDERIAFIFDTVKNSMRWNGLDEFYTNDGTVKAWDTKTGNSAEINMMVYHLLKKAGIKSYPLLVCSKNNEKINPANPTIFLFNNTVVLIPIDSTRNYVLDATSKYNLYNTIPEGILNTFGLSIDVHDALSPSYGDNLKAYNMIFISADQPVMQSAYFNVEIKPEGKMIGNAELTGYGYNKMSSTMLFDLQGEKKYLDSLKNNDNSLKIDSFRRENSSVDSLPLVQKFNFSLDLSGSDANYIYFNTDFLHTVGKNPFYNNERFSDIDFGYLHNRSFYSIFKLPAGYKADALPKSITLVMPDQSIIFKRTIAGDDNTIFVKYVIVHRKSLYFKEDYQDLKEFYKKMYDLLNEQIVLKKS